MGVTRMTRPKFVVFGDRKLNPRPNHAEQTLTQVATTEDLTEDVKDVEDQKIGILRRVTFRGAPS
jgi:hypothetical protein